MGRVLSHSRTISVLALSCPSAKASRASDSGLDMLMLSRTKSFGLDIWLTWCTLVFS